MNNTYTATSSHNVVGTRAGFVKMARFLLSQSHNPAQPHFKLLCITDSLYVNCIDPPSKPGRPEIADSDRTIAEIVWTSSSNDGGNPIQKYVIEKRLASEPWETVRFYLSDFPLFIHSFFCILGILQN